jgi:hypothetical protein
MKSQPSDTGGTADAIDAINREADRIYQERHRHCEPDAAWVADEFAELCRAEIAMIVASALISSPSMKAITHLRRA